MILLNSNTFFGQISARLTFFLANLGYDEEEQEMISGVRVENGESFTQYCRSSLRSDFF